MRDACVRIESIYGNLDLFITDELFPEFELHTVPRKVDGYCFSICFKDRKTGEFIGDWSEFSNGLPQFITADIHIEWLLKKQLNDDLKNAISGLSGAIKSDTFVTIKNVESTMDLAKLMTDARKISKLNK